MIPKRCSIPVLLQAAYLCMAACMAAGVLCCGRGPAEPALGGKIAAITGSAEILRAGEDAWREAAVGNAIDFGDSIATGGESKAEIRFGGNAVTIDESTLVAVNPSVDSAGRRGIEIFNCAGGVLSNIEKLTGGHETFTVRTPTAVASIRGTYFYVTFAAEAELSHVDVFRGEVWVINPLLPPAPPVIVLPGFYTEVRPVFVPVMPAAIPYGQWKKMAWMMPRPLYLRYHQRLKFHRFGPPGTAPKFIKPRRGALAPVKLRRTVVAPGRGGPAARGPGMRRVGPAIRGGPAMRGPAVRPVAPLQRGPAVQRLGPARSGPAAPAAPMIRRPGAAVRSAPRPAAPAAPRMVRPGPGRLRPAIAPLAPKGAAQRKRAAEDEEKDKKGKRKR